MQSTESKSGRQSRASADEVDSFVLMLSTESKRGRQSRASADDAAEAPPPRFSSSSSFSFSSFPPKRRRVPKLVEDAVADSPTTETSAEASADESAEVINFLKPVAMFSSSSVIMLKSPSASILLDNES